MTFEEMKQKAAEVWAQLRGEKEEAHVIPMRSDPGDVIQTNGEAYRPVAVEDARHVSVNGTVYRTTDAVLYALQQAAGRTGGVTEILNASLHEGVLVRVPETEQGRRPDLAIRYEIAPAAYPTKGRGAEHDRGITH